MVCGAIAGEEPDALDDLFAWVRGRAGCRHPPGGGVARRGDPVGCKRIDPDHARGELEHCGFGDHDHGGLAGTVDQLTRGYDEPSTDA
jgi:hypothetical protein